MHINIQQCELLAHVIGLIKQVQKNLHAKIVAQEKEAQDLKAVTGSDI